MRFSVLGLTLALATLVGASPTKRAPSVVVTLSTDAPSVSSIDDLSITATIENTSTDDIDILKAGTVLDENLPTRSFIVTKDGVEVPFTGIVVQISLKALDVNSSVTIPAGESVSVTHTNLGPLYDFASFGPGTFSFTAETTFQAVVTGADGTLTVDPTLIVADTPEAVEIEVTSDVASREIPASSRKDIAVCSDRVGRAFIVDAFGEGLALAALAAEYIRQFGASDPLYQAFFATNRVSVPLEVFDMVANEDSDTRTFSCTDPYDGCSPDTIAYTYMPTGDIYLCSLFFTLSPTADLCTGYVAPDGIASGTIIHELTHALANTDDIGGYGCDNPQILAASSPSQAVLNAGNYNCFAAYVAAAQC